MSKFKIGDHVIVKKGITLYSAKFGNYKAGDIGVVRRIETNGSSLFISLLGRQWGNLYVHESELEHDTIHATKLFKVLSE